jgi:LacI family transcriptional regulator
MKEWVKSLPKPIGIMAAYDRLGLQLLEACRDAGIPVPESVAVLGVDNDELICELSTPALTSIIPNTRQTGYEAAQTLDRMMNGEIISKLEHSYEPLGIQVRQSTDVLATNDEIIAGALHFIRNNACSGIGVNDVLATTPLSRRAFEKRFQKAIGKTPHAEILAAKLNFVKRLLKDTELSLEEIANRSGFTHPEYLSVAFKRETSVSPSEYRKFNK